jgi:hypothetical protein
LQDIGEKHGLLIKTEMAERCSDEEGGCSCAEAGADFPTECYRYAPILTHRPTPEEAGKPTGKEYIGRYGNETLRKEAAERLAKK